MYRPEEDILTHPDFTEVNHIWDKISAEHKEALHRMRVRKNTVGIALIGVGFALITWDIRKKR